MANGVCRFQVGFVKLECWWHGTSSECAYIHVDVRRCALDVSIGDMWNCASELKVMICWLNMLSTVYPHDQALFMIGRFETGFSEA